MAVALREADSGICPVIAKQLVSIECRTFDQARPIPDRKVRDGVVTEPSLRMLERGDFVRCRVRGNDEPFAACHLQRKMTRCMSGSIDSPEPGYDIIAGLQHDNPVLDRSEIALCAGGELMQFRRGVGAGV